MVVQPNVITRDKTAGVQTGEMVRVTGTGFETLHNMSRGLFGAGHSPSKHAAMVYAIAFTKPVVCIVRHLERLSMTKAGAKRLSTLPRVLATV
jgi:hypothetical protein